ncbi:unnamed protein product [Meganyctiphanes norvegica]|uniref:Protein sleepless n=1 Tax=Meganyctiphanes norvegica TaxID=48144 RepID=A0AAV2PHC3_MEGNR
MNVRNIYLLTRFILMLQIHSAMSSISCYRCSGKFCAEYDGTEECKRDVKHCLKRITTSKVTDVEGNYYSCGHVMPEDFVDGCYPKAVSQPSDRTSTMECVCSGDLCNSANLLLHGVPSYMTIVICIAVLFI